MFFGAVRLALRLAAPLATGMFPGVSHSLLPLCAPEALLPASALYNTLSITSVSLHPPFVPSRNVDVFNDFGRASKSLVQGRPLLHDDVESAQDWTRDILELWPVSDPPDPRRFRKLR